MVLNACVIKNHSIVYPLFGNDICTVSVIAVFDGYKTRQNQLIFLITKRLADLALRELSKVFTRTVCGDYQEDGYDQQ